MKKEIIKKTEYIVDKRLNKNNKTKQKNPTNQTNKQTKRSGTFYMIYIAQ